MDSMKGWGKLETEVQNQKTMSLEWDSLLKILRWYTWANIPLVWTLYLTVTLIDGKDRLEKKNIKYISPERSRLFACVVSRYISLYSGVDSVKRVYSSLIVEQLSLSEIDTQTLATAGVTVTLWLSQQYLYKKYRQKIYSTLNQ